ncbi:polysaccharide biosynthesis/export family protein [Jannaschia sp. 2305UL9-9]|uniref:polysaccharide biosynthesis/export family protein n=1 Tax=Jannaschia sp. 2305UL9-9 TaxID=3121638 RepID=UPI003528E583
MINHAKHLLAGCLLVLLSVSAAAAQGYRVQPGDVLRIEVLEDSDLNRDVLVAPDGGIVVPFAGQIQARGRSLGAIQNDVVSALAPNFAAGPTVVVSLSRLAEEDPPLPVTPAPEPVVTIFAIGEVANAGRLELVPGTRLLQALAQLGGFSDFAARKRIQLRRTNPVTGAETIYPLNYEAIMSGRSQNGSVVMQEGDVILVPTRRLFE